jgi:hypothetical protein
MGQSGARPEHTDSWGYTQRDWAAARALCEYGVLTVDGKVATMSENFPKLLQMARIALNAADEVANA